MAAASGAGRGNACSCFSTNCGRVSAELRCAAKSPTLEHRGCGAEDRDRHERRRKFHAAGHGISAWPICAICPATTATARLRPEMMAAFCAETGVHDQVAMVEDTMTDARRGARRIPASGSSTAATPTALRRGRGPAGGARRRHSGAAGDAPGRYAALAAPRGAQPALSVALDDADTAARPRARLRRDHPAFVQFCRCPARHLARTARSVFSRASSSNPRPRAAPAECRAGFCTWRYLHRGRCRCVPCR